MKYVHVLLLLFFIAPMACAQKDFTAQLYETYEDFKEPTLQKRRIKYAQIQPLIDKLRGNPKFEVQKVGESIEGRDLNLISIGSGNINIFLWSQMHGDEPTATMAIFDILNFLDSDQFTNEKKQILSHLKLHFLPMLNPDGAEVFQRRNALGIDINRDALRLQSPEGQTLKKVRDSLNADFGFNLHDQSRYYNAERTEKPATISYLATAYNYEKEVNEVRANAMKVIVYMNSIIQKYAPGQVGRYNDDFEPRAFGDNIAKWGTSLILIESGGLTNDPEKQEIRKLNYVSILSALQTIADASFKGISIAEYEKIPRNDRNLFDLKIKNLTYLIDGKPYVIDLGIHRQEIDLAGHDDFYYKSIIVDQGDLSTFFGYETFDATGYTAIAPKLIKAKERFSKTVGTDYKSLHELNVAFVKAPTPKQGFSVELPIHWAGGNFILPESFSLKPGVNPTFFLEKDGLTTHAIINGFLLDLNKPFEEQHFGNALIYR